MWFLELHKNLMKENRSLFLNTKNGIGNENLPIVPIVDISLLCLG
jgi:hypothetical protein